MHLKALCTACFFSVTIVLITPARAWDVNLPLETNKTLVTFSRAAALSPVTGDIEEVEELSYRGLYVEFGTCRSFLSDVKTIFKGETQIFDPLVEFATSNPEKGVTIIVPTTNEENSTTPVATLGLRTESVPIAANAANTPTLPGLDLSPKDQEEGRPLTRFLGEDILLFLSFGDDSEFLTDTVSTTFQATLTRGDTVSIVGFDLDLILEEGSLIGNNRFDVEIEATDPATSETLSITKSVSCGEEFTLTSLFPAFVRKPGIQVLVRSSDIAIAGSARESLPSNGRTTFLRRNMDASGRPVLGSIIVN
jgi:hypothetical protein